MLPYLAQGAAMAIEDAAVLAPAWRTPRTIRAPPCAATSANAAAVPRAFSAPPPQRDRLSHGRCRGVLRTFALIAMGGKRLIRRYDWLYGWKPA